MAVSEPEKKMKKALKDAGHTIAEYIDPAPGEERDAEETLDEIIGKIDNDEVGQAIAQSDQAEGKKPEDLKQSIADLDADERTRPFADALRKAQVEFDTSKPDEKPSAKIIPLGTTGL